MSGTIYDDGPEATTLPDRQNPVKVSRPTGTDGIYTPSLPRSTRSLTGHLPPTPEWWLMDSKPMGSLGSERRRAPGATVLVTNQRTPTRDSAGRTARSPHLWPYGDRPTAEITSIERWPEENPQSLQTRSQRNSD